MKKGIVLVALAVLSIAVLATGCRNNSKDNADGISAVPDVTAAPISNVAPATTMPATTVPTTQRVTEKAGDRVSEAASGVGEAMRDDVIGMSEAASDMAQGMRNAGHDLADGMRNVGDDLKDGFGSDAGKPGVDITDRMDELSEATRAR